MCNCCFVFFFKQKTAYEMRISDWSSDVCSSDLTVAVVRLAAVAPADQRGARHADAQGDRLEGQVVRVLDVGDDAEPVGAQAQAVAEIGRASCRERVCKYV